MHESPEVHVLHDSRVQHLSSRVNKAESIKPTSKPISSSADSLVCCFARLPACETAGLRAFDRSVSSDYGPEIESFFCLAHPGKSLENGDYEALLLVRIGSAFRVFRLPF